MLLVAIWSPMTVTSHNVLLCAVHVFGMAHTLLCMWLQRDGFRHPLSIAAAVLLAGVLLLALLISALRAWCKPPEWRLPEDRHALDESDLDRIAEEEVKRAIEAALHELDPVHHPLLPPTPPQERIDLLGEVAAKLCTESINSSTHELRLEMLDHVATVVSDRALVQAQAELERELNSLDSELKRLRALLAKERKRADALGNARDEADRWAAEATAVAEAAERAAAAALEELNRLRRQKEADDADAAAELARLKAEAEARAREADERSAAEFARAAAALAEAERLKKALLQAEEDARRRQLELEEAQRHAPLHLVLPIDVHPPALVTNLDDERFRLEEVQRQALQRRLQEMLLAKLESEAEHAAERALFQARAELAREEWELFLRASHTALPESETERFEAKLNRVAAEVANVAIAGGLPLPLPTPLPSPRLPDPALAEMASRLLDEMAGHLTEATLREAATEMQADLDAHACGAVDGSTSRRPDSSSLRVCWGVAC
jgi:hypothetical protein